MRRKVMGCWLGKAVGGTLGMPYEGVRDRLALTFYDPVPTEMLPNDDLDLQVIYAFLLDRMETPRVDRHVLADAWQHIGMSPDEYGVCKRNLKLGLRPPVTGWYDNWFTDGMGAAIRTELWACLAPGNPRLAAAYAYEDACMDHAGEGIHAAQYLAAIQSLAFVEQDTNTLLDAGLSVIPSDCKIAQSQRDTRAWWTDCRDLDWVYQQIHRRYGHDNFTDVSLNLAFITLGWLSGEGDFSRSICNAVNCGEDTDCTGATLGALLGIIDPASVSDRWLKPIGQDLVLSGCITGVDHPPTLDGFTDQVLGLRDAIAEQEPSPKPVSDNVSHLAIRAALGFVDEMPSSGRCPTLPANTKTVTFPGTLGQLEPNQWAGAVACVRYRIDLDKPQSVRLVFNTPNPVRVYWDDDLMFQRGSGPMTPAFHRTPADQSVNIASAAAGQHTVTAWIARDEATNPTPWVIALAEHREGLAAVDAEWLIDPFRRVGATLNPG